MRKKIVILGAGESGTGSAILAKRKGHDVFVSDAGEIKSRYRNLLDAHGLIWEEGQHSIQELLKAEEVIKSPGIPDDAPVVSRLKENHIPVVSEIEFAGRYNRGKTICVTGSNGKTTTTNLIFHMMKKAGMDVEMAGNVGRSFALVVAEKEPEYVVLELSSFQLDGMFDFKADVAIITNITPDHLDRYGNDMDRYVASKFRITRNQSSHDFLIYCYDDERIKTGLGRFKPASVNLPFSIRERMDQVAYVENSNLYIHYNKDKITMSIHDLALKGKHNIYNSMAAGIAGQVLRIRKEIIRESLSDFQGVEHRLEPVIRVHGIMFINDSKATNVNSTWYALESMSKNVILILGGIDKGNDYSSLEPLIREKVRAIICLGKDNTKILNAFEGKVPKLVEARSMEEAVKKSYVIGKKGDTVLLSPACASFDLFENYEDRGRQFKESVRNL